MRPGSLRAASGGLCGLALCALPVQAHHSVAAQYDTSRVVSIEGDVRSLEITSPHSHLLIEVSRPDGSSVSWRAELASAASLYRAGWSRYCVAIGEHVRVTGAPSRANATELYLTDLTKADGSHLQLLPRSSVLAAPAAN
jgi:hypothetical protein